MLTKDQYKVLETLATIKLHNSNRKNLKIKFQSARYNKEDIQFLIENKFMRLSMADEYYLTDAGVRELKNRY